MKSVYEVLALKEVELEQVRREVDALRIVAPLLAEGESVPKMPPQGVQGSEVKEASSGTSQD